MIGCLAVYYLIKHKIINMLINENELPSISNYEIDMMNGVNIYYEMMREIYGLHCPTSKKISKIIKEYKTKLGPLKNEY